MKSPRIVALEALAGEGPLQPFPLEETPCFIPSARIWGLLTSCSQAYALGWLVPPRAAGNCKLVNIAIGPQVLSSGLGYVREAVYVYKELGGTRVAYETSTPLTIGRTDRSCVCTRNLIRVGPASVSWIRCASILMNGPPTVEVQSRATDNFKHCRTCRLARLSGWWCDSISKKDHCLHQSREKI
jgi:hypothetical protein